MFVDEFGNVIDGDLDSDLAAKAKALMDDSPTINQSPSKKTESKKGQRLGFTIV